MPGSNRASARLNSQSEDRRGPCSRRGEHEGKYLPKFGLCGSGGFRGRLQRGTDRIRRRILGSGRLRTGADTVRAGMRGNRQQQRALRPVRQRLRHRQQLHRRAVRVPGGSHQLQRPVCDDLHRRGQLWRLWNAVPERAGLRSRLVHRDVPDWHDPMWFELRGCEPQPAALRSLRHRLRGRTVLHRR